MHILAISRSPRFSPDSVARDAHVFSLMTDCLRRQGALVEVTDEDTFAAADISLPSCDALVHQARGHAALQKMRQLESQGLMVVNAPCAVLRLHDGSDLSGIWAASHIPVPLSEPYHAETAVQTGFPLWAKRVCGDAGGREVRFVASGDALQELASHIKEDTSARYMLSPHVEGDVVKCYGVLGTPFFAWRYALTASAASSDAPERHNAPLQAYPFDESALMQLAGDAARAAGLCVFGADIVVKPDGSFALIDLNDFPSFQGFHAEAAQAIARLCFAKTGQQPSEQ